MMASYPDPYFKLTLYEVEDLDSWSFLSSYGKYRQELVDLAKEVFCILTRVLRAHPDEAQLYREYWRTLMRDDLYRKKILKRKWGLSPLAYEYYAQLLAKYVIYHDRDEINSSYCY